MEEAVKAITNDPAALEEIKALLPQLEAANAPAGDDFVAGLLTKVGLICGIPWDDPDVMAMAKREYFDVLSGLPREALSKGVDAFKANDLSNYGFPKPARLLTFAQPFATELKIALGRARKAATRQATAARQITPEERRAEIERLKAEGILDANGKVILNFKKPPAPEPDKEAISAKARERMKAIAKGEDPHLQRMKDAPIPRTSTEFP